MFGNLKLHNSSEDVAKDSNAAVRNNSWVLGALIAAAIKEFILIMMFFGVPAGAQAVVPSVIASRYWLRASRAVSAHAGKARCAAL